MVYGIVVVASLLTAQVDCPPEGRPRSEGHGHFDPDLNRLKNRTEVPATYTELDVGQFLGKLTPDLGLRGKDLMRAHLRPQVAQELAARERQGIALVGYLIGAIEEGPENCNCEVPRPQGDFHLQVTQTPEDGKARTVVVEVTPRIRAHQAGWKFSTLHHLAKTRARVRIKGWLMYDPEHWDQLGKTRATLWEVHPITSIEVWSEGRWQAL